MIKKALIIGLGSQGQQYVKYFLKQKYKVQGLCKTVETQKNIQKRYNINVLLEYENIILNEYDIIVLPLPSDIQGSYALDILSQGYTNPLLIETPVSWNQEEINSLKSRDNVIFFLEEYYTLLSQLIQNIDISKIEKISVNVYISKNEYNNKQAREVALLHVRNNFLGIQNVIFEYNFTFHDSPKIYYEIQFKYLLKNITYVFHTEKYLKVGDKKYIDPFHFDGVLTKLLGEKNDIQQYYELKL